MTLLSIKNTVLKACSALQIPQSALYFTQNRARIVLYHGVYPYIDNWGIFNYRKKFITPGAFRKQMVWIKKKFEILPLSRLVELIVSQKGFPKRSIAITLDDGYKNNFDYVFPILQELNIPATIFLTTDFVDQKGPLWVDMLEYAIGNTSLPSFILTVYGKEKNFKTSSFEEKRQTDNFLRSYLKKISRNDANILLESIIEKTGKDLRKTIASSPYKALDWKEIRQMQDNGIAFGSHTLSHPILSNINYFEQEGEILLSKKRLDENGITPLPIFAYPNGQPQDFTKDTVNILKKTGFIASLTTLTGAVESDSDPFMLPRFTMDGTDSQYFFKTTISGVRSAIIQLIE